MRIEYTELFIKDLKALKSTPYDGKIRSLCFDAIPQLTSWREIRHLKKMEGYEHYYRIKQGDYRIGIKIEGNSLIFMRVLHRKDVYREFP